MYSGALHFLWDSALLPNQPGERSISRQKEKAPLGGGRAHSFNSPNTQRVYKEQATDWRVVMEMVAPFHNMQQYVTNTFRTLELKREPLQTLFGLQSGRGHGDAG